VKQGKPLARKTPLNAVSAERLKAFGGRLPRSSLDKPGQPKTPPKPKRCTDTGPDKLTVERVWARDRGKCISCGEKIHGDRGGEWCISHRKLRSQGGDNRLSNLMLSCGNGSWGCEAEYHRGPERARQAGFMLLSTEDPAEIPVEHAIHGRVLLTDDGGFIVLEAREEPYGHPF
jgi:hypothetical protein